MPSGVWRGKGAGVGGLVAGVCVALAAADGGAAGKDVEGGAGDAGAEAVHHAHVVAVVAAAADGGDGGGADVVAAATASAFLQMDCVRQASL